MTSAVDLAKEDFVLLFFSAKAKIVFFYRNPPLRFGLLFFLFTFFLMKRKHCFRRPNVSAGSNKKSSPTLRTPNKPPFADVNVDYIILLRGEGFYQLLKTRCLRLSILLSLAFARFHAVSKTLYSMSCILFSDAQ